MIRILDRESAQETQHPNKRYYRKRDHIKHWERSDQRNNTRKTFQN